MDNKWICLVIISILVTGYVCCTSKDRYIEGGWTCAETGCEFGTGGKYASREECMKSGCALPESYQEKKVFFADQVQVYY